MTERELAKEVWSPKEWDSTGGRTILAIVAHGAARQGFGKDWTEAAQLIVSNTKALYGLGPRDHPEGAVLLSDFAPHRAYLHIAVWSPRWMGRRAVWRGILRHIFDRFKLAKINTLIPKENRFAIKLAKRVGFTKEGDIRREFLYINGGVGDGELWGITPEEV